MWPCPLLFTGPRKESKLPAKSPETQILFQVQVLDSHRGNLFSSFPCSLLGNFSRRQLCLTSPVQSGSACLRLQPCLISAVESILVQWSGSDQSSSPHDGWHTHWRCFKVPHTADEWLAPPPPFSRCPHVAAMLAVCPPWPCMCVCAWCYGSDIYCVFSCEFAVFVYRSVWLFGMFLNNEKV